MGRGEFSAAIDDFLSGTAIQTFTCDEIATAVERKLGYKPPPASVSRTIGQRTDWRRIMIDGKVAFTKRP